MSKSVRAALVATSLSSGEDKEHWMPPGEIPLLLGETWVAFFAVLPREERAAYRDASLLN
jgi:hypothetical protein